MDELAKLYVNADAFIMPSYRFDTQAITLSEAAVAGLPIVYCDDRLDVGVNSDNSLLATDPGPEALATCLTALNSPEVRKEKASASMRIAKQLQPDFTVERYLELYRQLIGSKH